MSSLDKFVKSRNFTAVIKLDTQARKGKAVTIVDGLPKNTLLLDAMLKALKSRCGCGGTVRTEGRDGAFEIQGDQREKVRAYLAEENISFKG